MEHPRIDEDRIIDRYLAGRLPSDDEAAFEEHLFECADCLEKVQWGEELRRGLQAVAAEDAARATATLSLMAWLRGRQPLQLAGLFGLLLAVVMLPAVLVWQKIELGRLQERVVRLAVARTGLAEPTGALAVVSLGVVRDGGDAVSEISPDPNKDAILLSLELQTVAAAHYRVTLLDAQGATVWSGDGLEPNLYDTLLVALPTSYLTPGQYRILIEGLEASGTETASEMEFRVLAE